MLKDHYDIIIVGAGPAGLACALELKMRGAEDFVVLERFQFPRSKCCAGYITGKTRQAYEAFGLSMEDCHYSFIEDFGIYWRGGERQKIVNRFLYTNRGIDRVELDHEFFKLARAKGVRIEENCRVSAIDRQAGTITVNDSRTVSFNKLVLADGAMGIGSKLQEPLKRNIAMQLIFRSGRPDSIELHFGISPKGYGWISSFGGLTNIGLTDEFRKDADYRKLFADYMRGAGLDPDELLGSDGTAEQRASGNAADADKNASGKPQLHAAFTPIGVKEPVLDDRIYFAGDALGACDPFTLSGLRYGLKSGRTAAEAMVLGNNGLYRKYAGQLKRRFGFSRFLMKCFYLKPVQFLVFRVGCKCFGGLISTVFNTYFVNKK